MGLLLLLLLLAAWAMLLGARCAIAVQWRSAVLCKARPIPGMANPVEKHFDAALAAPKAAEGDKAGMPETVQQRERQRKVRRMRVNWTNVSVFCTVLGAAGVAFSRWRHRKLKRASALVS